MHLPTAGIETGSATLQVDSLPAELSGKPILQNKDEMKLLSGRENRRDKSKTTKTEKLKFPMEFLITHFHHCPSSQGYAFSSGHVWM